MSDCKVKDWIEYFKGCDPEAYVYTTKSILYTRDATKHEIYYDDEKAKYRYVANPSELSSFYKGVELHNADAQDDRLFKYHFPKLALENFNKGKQNFKSNETDLQEQIDWMAKNVVSISDCSLFLIGSEWMTFQELESKLGGRKIETLLKDLFDQHETSRIFICKLDYENMDNVLFNPIGFLKEKAITSPSSQNTNGEEDVVVVKTT